MLYTLDFDLKVAFCGVKNLADARYAAALGAEWIIYDLEKDSPDYVKPYDVVDMIGWVDGVKNALIINNRSVEDKRQLNDLLKYDAEVHYGSGDAADKVYYIGEGDLNSISFKRPTFLVEYDEQLLPHYLELSNSKGFYVLLNNPTAATAELIRKHQPYGILLTGQIEEEEGMRDFGQLNDFIEALEG